MTKELSSSLWYYLDVRQHGKIQTPKCNSLLFIQVQLKFCHCISVQILVKWNKRGNISLWHRFRKWFTENCSNSEHETAWTKNCISRNVYAAFVDVVRAQVSKSYRVKNQIWNSQCKCWRIRIIDLIKLQIKVGKVYFGLRLEREYTENVDGIHDISVFKIIKFLRKISMLSKGVLFTEQNAGFQIVTIAWGFPK